MYVYIKYIKLFMSIYINSYTLFSSFILYIFISVLGKPFFPCISKCSFHSLFAETASCVTSEMKVKQLSDFISESECSLTSYCLGATTPLGLTHFECDILVLIRKRTN